jgi:adenylate cyclase
MTDLMGKMRQVLEGDLSGHWSPRTTDEFFDLGIGFNAMLLGLRERETIKDTFGRFVSHEVAEVVLAGRVPLNGEVREVTILFQDIRGFTSLSERTPPVALLQLVNDFFTEMVAAVEAQGGIVKQFLGDGVMALFGVPAVHADAPARAVRTALDMLARLDVFNTRRQAQGEAPLRIGVGIHTGEVIAGCIGPDTRLEYGVVGDAVNLASRVQDLTKQVGTAILVTDDTAARLGAGFVLGTRTVLPVRGKTQPIGVIEVLGELPGVPASPVLVKNP